jgi:dihydrofolate reductase
VFSRTLREITVPGVHLVAADAREFVRDLKSQPGKGICLMSGGDLAQSLFEADLVDEVRLNIHPILLGSGVPLFRDAGRRIPLELVESRCVDGGCVLASYRVRSA